MSEIRECLTQLLSMQWNEKFVWEHIRDGELTAAPAFKGDLYDTMPIKIMYVGHAVNGWEIDTSDCMTLENTVENILKQQGALDTFVNADGYPYIKDNGKTGIYYHINSNFIRLIKQILEYQKESDSPTTRDTWYNDTKEWHRKFIWSNLYNIAPRNGGNPEDKFIKLGMAQYAEMMKIQIETFKPDIVIFCPLSGYFVPWKRQPSFDEILDWFETCDDGPIIGKGQLGQTQIVVCKRPDVFGNSYEDVQVMAKVISEYIDCKCKNNM